MHGCARMQSCLQHHFAPQLPNVGLSGLHYTLIKTNNGLPVRKELGCETVTLAGGMEFYPHYSNS